MYCCSIVLSQQYGMGLWYGVCLTAAVQFLEVSVKGAPHVWGV